MLPNLGLPIPLDSPLMRAPPLSPDWPPLDSLRLLKVEMETLASDPLRCPTEAAWTPGRASDARFIMRVEVKGGEMAGRESLRRDLAPAREAVLDVGEDEVVGLENDRAGCERREGGIGVERTVG